MDWIQIEKDKPRGGEHVLVTLYWADDDWYEVCEMDYGVLKAEGNSLIDNVIAWMPLPEPYKKEKYNG